MTTPARDLYKQESLPRKAVAWLIAWYRQRPLLSGFVTLLLLSVLLAGGSSLFQPSDSGRGANRGVSREDRGKAGLRFVADSLRRFDDYDHWRYTEMLRDSLSQWLSQASPAGRWLPDPFATGQIPPQIRRALEYDTAEQQQVKNFSSEDAQIIQGAAWMRDISNTVRQRLAASRPGGIVEPLALAEGLFDWTMRHVALDEEDTVTPELAWESLLWGRAKWQSRAWIFMELCRQQGLETAMLAYRDPEKPGTKEKPRHRVWLTALLLVKREVNEKEPAPKETVQAYLFDPKLGLPLLGPGGKGVATLADAVEQPETLRQLDTGVRTYGVKSADWKGVLVLLDASPYLVSRRMQELESQLRGPDKLVLTSYPSRLAERCRRAKHVSAVHIWPWPNECLGMARAQQGVPQFQQRLLPFMMIGYERKGGRDRKLEEEHLQRFQELMRLQPKVEAPQLESEARQETEVSGFLWKGRMLQFKGVYEDPRLDGASAQESEDALARKQGAPNVFHAGRLSDDKIDARRAAYDADFEKLKELAQKDMQRGASEAVLLRYQAVAMRLQNQRAIFPFERLGRQFARALATSWIGQIAYERGDYKDAIDYFRNFRDKELKTLQAFDAKEASPELRTQLQEFRKAQIEPWLPIWDNAARDGLARALEAAGQYQEAIELYEQDTSPDQRLGSLIRARRLREKLAAAEKKK